MTAVLGCAVLFSAVLGGFVVLSVRDTRSVKAQDAAYREWEATGRPVLTGGRPWAPEWLWSARRADAPAAVTVTVVGRALPAAAPPPVCESCRAVPAVTAVAWQDGAEFLVCGPCAAESVKAIPQITGGVS